MPGNNVVELIVRLQDKLSVPLQGLNAKLEAFSGRVTALLGIAGIAGVAATLGSFAKSSFQAADAIGDAADRAGIAVDSLSRLKYAAEQNDVDFNSLTASLKRWQVTLSQAASGSQDAASALGLLKLNASALKSLTLENQLKAIADQFARIKDPADQTRVAVELFGRSGEQLVPLLRQGGGAIADLTAEADKLGITLDQKTTGAVDRADKAIKKLLATLSAAGQRAVGSIAENLVGPLDNIDAAERTLKRLEDDRKAFLRGAANFLPADQIEKELARLDARIAGARQALEVVKNAETAFQADQDKNALAIPDDSRISEVIITQRKAELEGLAKLLDDFEKSTRVSEDKIYQDYKDTVAKIQELLNANVISTEEAARRIAGARAQYESEALIDPVQITQTKAIIQQTLTENQRAVNKFVDTLTVGLDNLAHSGELTGKSILKYLLSAFEAQVLKDAIAALGSYLKKSLGGSGSGGSSTGNFIGSILNAVFGHSAGGGSISGPRIVGEEGPEIFMGSGNILNRRQLQFAMAGGGGSVNFSPSTVVNVQGNADSQTLAALPIILQQNNKKLLEEWSKRMKDNYGRAPR